MAIEIEVVERTIKASIEEALKRMRQTDEKLNREAVEETQSWPRP